MRPGRTWLETIIAESGDFMVTVALNIGSTQGGWSGDIRDAKVNLRRETNIREILEAVVLEIEPILRKWGIKTENSHEIFVIGFQDTDTVWSLVVSLIADKEDTDYSYD